MRHERQPGEDQHEQHELGDLKGAADRAVEKIACDDVDERQAHHGEHAAEVQRCRIAGFEIRRRFGIRRDHFIAKFLDRAGVAQLLDPLFLHNRGRALAAGKHFRENFLPLFAADLSAVDQIDQLVERFRRNRTIVDRFASGAERTL